MEKDLKDKKPAENGTPKVPWPKLIPAAAVIAALVFSGIKAQGSDANTESVQKADTTVMSASELEKYLGYEETSDPTDNNSTAAEKSSTSKKSTSKKSTKKTAAKKSSGKRTVSESARNNASAAGQGSTQTPVAMFRQTDIKTEPTKAPEPDSAEPSASVYHQRWKDCSH